jgi:hypothetical protein
MEMETLEGLFLQTQPNMKVAIASARAVYYDFNGLGNGFGLGLKNYGFSVRLIKD